MMIELNHIPWNTNCTRGLYPQSLVACVRGKSLRGVVVAPEARMW